LAQWLNKHTGGDEIRPGWFDISPEAIDLAVDTFTGSAGRFASDFVSLPPKLISGKEVETYEVPILRKVYGKPGASSIYSEYYKNRNDIKIVYRQLRHYKDDPKKKRAILKRRHREKKLIPAMKMAQKRISELKRMKKKLQRDNAPKTKIKRIEKRIQTAMKQFNNRYQRTMSRNKN
jgi:hypothetical protein